MAVVSDWLPATLVNFASVIALSPSSSNLFFFLRYFLMVAPLLFPLVFASSECKQCNLQALCHRLPDTPQSITGLCASKDLRRRGPHLNSHEQPKKMLQPRGKKRKTSAQKKSFEWLSFLYRSPEILLGATTQQIKTWVPLDQGLLRVLNCYLRQTNPHSKHPALSLFLAFFILRFFDVSFSLLDGPCPILVFTLWTRLQFIRFQGRLKTVSSNITSPAKNYWLFARAH